MTKHHDFKQIVRERMKKTGERYTAARAMLLQSRDSSPASPAAPRFKGAFPMYSTFGGVCRDTGALRNVLAASVVRSAHNHAPLSEALATGLCGGVGFLYAVFEYKNMPPMLSIMCRYDTMPDAFIAGGIERLGLRANVSETSSATTARKALDAAIAAGVPAICIVDSIGLAADESTAAMHMAGMAPTVVAVAGVDGDELLVDDGGVAPRRMTFEKFMRARALYKKGRNRLITIDRPPAELDLAKPVRSAVSATALRYFESPYKGFASNFGVAGLEKWHRLLTDPKDKKGWAAVFDDSQRAYLALRRTHDGIEQEFTSPAAGRPLFAEFLTEAARITGEKAFAAAAEEFRRSGDRWRELTHLIATCGDPEVEEGCTLGDSARELFDEAECDWRGVGEIQRNRESLAKRCRISRERAMEIFAALAPIVGEILEIEQPAAKMLQAAAGRRR